MLYYHTWPPKHAPSWEWILSLSPLVEYVPNFKHELLGPNQILKLMLSRLIWSVQVPLMEDNLKVSKIQYLSNPQSKGLSWRWPLKEDDSKVLNVAYLTNHWPDLFKMSNLRLVDKSVLYRGLCRRYPPMEEDLKVLKVEFLSIHHLDLLFFKVHESIVHRGLKWKTSSV